jgi:hypothetical protein
VPVDKYYLVNYEPTLDVQIFFDSIREAVMSFTGTDRVSITLAELSVQPQNVDFHIDPNNHWAPVQCRVREDQSQCVICGSYFHEIRSLSIFILLLNRCIINIG